MIIISWGIIGGSLLFASNYCLINWATYYSRVILFEDYIGGYYTLTSERLILLANYFKEYYLLAINSEADNYSKWVLIGGYYFSNFGGLIGHKFGLEMSPEGRYWLISDFFLPVLRTEFQALYRRLGLMAARWLSSILSWGFSSFFGTFFPSRAKPTLRRLPSGTYAAAAWRQRIPKKPPKGLFGNSLAPQPKPQKPPLGGFWGLGWGPRSEAFNNTRDEWNI